MNWLRAAAPEETSKVPNMVFRRRENGKLPGKCAARLKARATVMAMRRLMSGLVRDQNAVPTRVVLDLRGNASSRGTGIVDSVAMLYRLSLNIRELFGINGAGTFRSSTSGENLHDDRGNRDEKNHRPKDPHESAGGYLVV